MTDYTKPSGTEINKIWAATGVKTPVPDNAKVSTGWVVEIPPREYFNYLHNKHDAFISHLNQHGTPIWDTNTEYLANTSYVMGSNGIVYRAVLSSGPPGTSVNPVGDVSGTWRVAYYFTTDVYTKSETDAKYLVRNSNLADIANTTTARTNLSVYSKAETDAKYPTIANNLSDYNASAARTNISVYSKSETDAKYLAISNNLSEVNAATARSNLGVYSTSESNANYLSKIANLGDLSDIGVARTNISVYSKAEGDGRYLLNSGNLSTISDAAAAFNNIKQAASDSYTGVTSFSTDVEVDNGSVTNKAIAPSKLKSGFSISLTTNGHIKFPAWMKGLHIRWGVSTVGANNSVTFSDAFTTNCLFVIAGLAASGGDDVATPKGYLSSNAFILRNTDGSAQPISYLAIGY